MNLGDSVNKVVEGAANKNVGNVVNSVNNSPSMPNSNIPSDTYDIELPSKKSKSGIDNLQDLAGNLPSNNSAKIDTSELNPKDKVDFGKEVGENGEIKDSSSKKLVTALGRGAAAYATGGESVGKDQVILNNQLGDKTIGVISDVAEKVPGVKIVADELEEDGVLDAVNDAMDIVGNVKNGDISGTIDKAGNVLKDVEKMGKSLVKRLAPIIIIPSIVLLFIIIIFIAIIGPVAGGFLDVTEKLGEVFDGVTDSLDNLFGGQGATDVLDEVVDNYNDLSEERKAVILSAASLLGWKYNWGGHPDGPGYDGVPTNGLDCGGYVQWVLWTALGENPGYLTTSSISDLIGTKFIQIREDELLPGDIGLKYKGHDSKTQNHVGIFAGKGKWLHAAGAKQGIIQSKYKSFTIYLRYVNLD